MPSIAISIPETEIESYSGIEDRMESSMRIVEVIVCIEKWAYLTVSLILALSLKLYNPHYKAGVRTLDAIRVFIRFLSYSCALQHIL